MKKRSEEKRRESTRKDKEKEYNHPVEGAKGDYYYLRFVLVYSVLCNKRRMNDWLVA